jgi:2-amino-4-hydroxy-6-hydroxymethyldihydropteridine diphosphokinase
MLQASFAVHKMSSVYETEPVGIDTDKIFLNMVAEVQVSGVAPSQMMARLLRIEYLLGRGDKAIRGPRTIDLDILFFGSDKIETEFLTVPHPRAHLRKFVLVPMNEVCPTFVHPTIHKNMATLLDECEDPSWVRRWDADQGLLGSAANIGLAEAATE